MAKYIKKKALKDAIANCTWYHINSKGELVEGANSNDDEPLYKYTDIKRIIKGLPIKKIAEPQTEGIKVGKWYSFTDYVVEMQGDSKPKEFRIVPQTEGSE